MMQYICKIYLAQSLPHKTFSISNSCYYYNRVMPSFRAIFWRDPPWKPNLTLVYAQHSLIVIGLGEPSHSSAKITYHLERGSKYLSTKNGTQSCPDVRRESGSHPVFPTKVLGCFRTSIISQTHTASIFLPASSYHGLDHSYSIRQVTRKTHLLQRYIKWLF